MQALRSLEYQILLVGLFVIGCAGQGGQKGLYRAQRPSWVGQTARGYFEGVSRPKATEAEARDEALWNAMWHITVFLGVRIDTEMRDWIREQFRKGNRSSLETATEVKIRVVAKCVLFRVCPEDWYIEVHGKQFIAHCCVPFSEEFHQAFVQEWITQAEGEAKIVYQGGVRQERAGEIGVALERYVQVVRVVNETEDVVDPWPKLFAPLRQLRGEAGNGLARLFGCISLSLENSGQIGAVGQRLPRPLVARVRFRTEGAEVPLAGIPVSFRFLSGKGNLDEILSTDGEGVVWCQVYIEECDREIQVGVMIGRADWKDWLGKEVAPPEAILRVPCRKRPIRMLVYVVEHMLSERSLHSIVAGRLVEAFGDIGASVIAGEGDPVDEYDMESVRAWARQQEADVVVWGTATSGPARRLASNLFICDKARLRVRAMEVESGAVLLAIQLPDERLKETIGFGNTADQAARRALALQEMPEAYEEIAQQLAAALR